MDALIPYLIFPGTCREAMEFYSEALSGKIIQMQTFEDSPVDVPDEQLKQRIFNSELKAGSVQLRASDDLPNYQVKTGTNVCLYAVFTDNQAKQTAFERLSQGGTVIFPLKENFGMLKDQYGLQWMIVGKNNG